MATPDGPLQLAWQFHQSGQFDLAARLYRQILAGDPRNPDVHHLLGMIALQQGQPQEALEHIGRAIESLPTQAQFHDHLADAYKLLGNHDAAIESYRRALAIDPHSAVTWNELGSELRVMEQTQEAEAAYRTAIELDPNMIAAHNNLGNVLQDQSLLAEAIVAFSHAAELGPDVAAIHFNQANCYRFQENYEQAAAAARRAVNLDPRLVQAYVVLGVSLHKLDQNAEAADWFREAIRLDPNLAEAHSGLALSLHARKNFQEAIESYRKAIAILPNSDLTLFNLATALHNEGQYDEAVSYYQRVVELAPENADALAAIGMIHHIQCDWDAARSYVERALAIAPDHPDFRFQLGILQLVHGDLKQGFQEFDFRSRGRFGSGRTFEVPRWEGESLLGKTLLVHWEYGYGDAFHFIRFLKHLPPAGRVMCEILPQLIPILKTSGFEDLVPFGTPHPAFDFHMPIMSLPTVLGTELHNLPNDVPYIFADPERVQQWRGPMAAIDGFKVGIHWQGNPDYFGDRHRSMRLEYFEPLAQVKDVRLISLQRGFGSEQIEEVADRFQVLTLPDLDDYNRGAFMDTAGILQNLDLVVTSDSAVAHLAGAMGLPVWLVITTAAEWRWFLDREDSPWYPTMRIFRQRKLDVWPEVFERIASELTVFKDRKRASGV